MIAPFLALLIAYVLSQFYRAFLAVIAEDLIRDLSLDSAGLGNLSASWFIFFALAQFPVGMALDRYGPRRVIAGLFLVAVAGASIFALAQAYLQALIGMALIGIGCSPILMGAMYFFGRTAAPERFALLGSLILGLGSLGNLLSAAPLALAVTAIGWRASVGCIAVATAFSAIIIFFVIRDPERIKLSADVKLGPLAALREIFSMRPILLMGLLMLLSYAAIASLRGLWVAPFFGTVHGFDTVARGNAALLMAFAMSCGALAFGALERRLGGPKNAVVLGSAGAACSLAALSMAGHSSAGLALALYALAGFSGMTYAVLLAHSRMFFPAHLLGRGVTAMNFLSIGGAGLLQWMSGHGMQMAQAAGWSPQAAFAAMHGIFAGLVLIALVPYLFTPARPAK